MMMFVLSVLWMMTVIILLYFDYETDFTRMNPNSCCISIMMLFCFLCLFKFLLCSCCGQGSLALSAH